MKSLKARPSWLVWWTLFLVPWLWVFSGAMTRALYRAQVVGTSSYEPSLQQMVPFVDISFLGGLSTPNERAAFFVEPSNFGPGDATALPGLMLNPPPLPPPHPPPAP